MILRETPGAFQTTILTLRTGHLFFVWQKDLFIVFHCGWKKIVRESVERVDACNCGAQETHQRLDFRAGGEEIAFKVPKTAVRLLPNTNTPKADINNNKYTRECEIWTRNIKF